MGEVWRGAIYQGVDYSWRFEVSTFGNLRSTKTKKIYSFGYDSVGYYHACISINGRRLNVRAHRCVAETFLPNPGGYEIVNHIDGCKQNNRIDNLEWCSRIDNYRHAVEHSLINPDVPAQIGYFSHLGVYAGSGNGMSKLKESDVLYIRAEYIPRGMGKKCNRKELADLFGVSPNLISKIVNRSLWTHV